MRNSAQKFLAAFDNLEDKKMKQMFWMIFLSLALVLLGGCGDDDDDFSGDDFSFSDDDNDLSDDDSSDDDLSEDDDISDDDVSPDDDVSDDDNDSSEDDDDIISDDVTASDDDDDNGSPDDDIVEPDDDISDDDTTCVPSKEICDNEDNDCDGDIDEGFAVGEECEEGIGECRFEGVNDCDSSGNNVICVGSPKEPSPEICDGLDNDCDGDVDENPEADASCDNGLFCDGEEFCRGGECQTGEEVNCSNLDGQCVVGDCSNEEQKCLEVDRNEGGSCDADGDGCTEGDFCQAGECIAGTAPDCSGVADECNDGVCHSVSANEFVCEKQPKTNGSQCDDGNLCTQTDYCQNGVCLGSNAVVCAAPDQCHEAGTCDPATGLCSNPNKPNGSQCDDGQFCTDGDYCQSGICRSGSARNCSAYADECNDGVCNESADRCEASPKSAGTSCGNSSSSQCDNPDTCDGAGNCESNFVSSGTNCDDGSYCNVGETCDGAGNCSGGSARDCDDGQYCNGTESCDDGIDDCVSSGNPCPETECNHCNEADDDCYDPSGTSCGNSSSSQCDNPDTCDGAGNCESNYVSLGTNCDDGSYCNVGETCDGAGDCNGGGPRDCSSYADQCNEAACDDVSETCYSNPIKEGESCDDGEVCTTSETCQSGSCSGVVDKDSDADTYIDDQCMLGTDCNDGDGAYHPGAADTVGDGEDQNCDGIDGVDADSDSLASIASGGTDCDDGDGSIGEAADGTCDGDGDTYIDETAGGPDCNDGDGDIHPGATDRLNLVDKNCDGFDGESEQVSSWSAKYLSIKLDSANKAHIIGGSGYHNDVSGVWQDELIDFNGGTYGSLAIDSLDNIHVSYAGVDGIRYATNKSGSWVITTIESGGDCSDNWDYTSIGIDSNDDVHIVYDCNNSTGAYFKHATNPGGIWQIETIQSLGVNARYISMAVLSDDTMAISWWLEPFALQISEGSWGNWSTVTRGDSTKYTAIAADDNDFIYVSHFFFNGSEDDHLRLATDNPAWGWETVATNGGPSNSIAVTFDGRSHIFYVDRWAEPDPLVRYITDDPQMTGDPTGNTWGSSVVGIAHSSYIWDLITSITLDSAGKPRAAYCGAGINCAGLCYVH